MTAAQIKLLRMVADAITATVREAGPMGRITAALAALCILAAPIAAKTVAETVSGIKLKPTWQDIEVNKNESEIVTLHYKPAIVVTPMMAAADTKAIARVVLRGMVDDGKPMQNVNLQVWAHQGVTGETGKPMVILFGSTDYDSSADALEWVPYQHSWWMPR